MHDRILNGEFERKQGAKGVVTHEPLKDCPFCGGAASLHNDTDSPCWFVGCSNSACHIEPCHYADTEAEAIATWNRRTPTPVAMPLTDEQIRAMCKEPWVFETAKQWVRITEQHHGITGGQHG